MKSFLSSAAATAFPVTPDLADGAALPDPTGGSAERLLTPPPSAADGPRTFSESIAEAERLVRSGQVGEARVAFQQSLTLAPNEECGRRVEEIVAMLAEAMPR